MSTSRHLRCVTALITLFSLLFMHLAVAAYTCPGEIPAQERMSSVHDVPGTQHEAPSGCAGMDMEQPSLCHAHGQTGNQSLDKPEHPQVQPFVASSLVLALTRFETPSAARPPDLYKTFSFRIPALSLAIRHCCFRI